MPRRPRPSEMRARLERASADLAFLAEHHAATVRNLSDWRHGPASGNGGPGPKNAVGDPTGNAATNLDEYGRLLERYLSAVDAVLRDTANASAVARQVVEPAVPPVPVPVGLVACANAHGCPDGSWGDHSRGRCSPCASYLRKYDRDRRLSGPPAQAEAQ